MNHLRKTLIVFLMILSSPFIFAQSGSVDTSLKMQSSILNREMPYSVYFPPGYEESSRPYPVLYLLHGMWGAHDNWATKGETQRIADEAINSGAAPEMIIVMPEGLIDAFYINNYDKSIRWEDFFYEEFIPEIESKFNVFKDRGNRAIAGLSMGGYGSLYHAVTHKEMFNSVYAMSSAVLERQPLKKGEEQSQFDRDFGLKTWGPINSEGYPENYKKHSVQEIFKAMDAFQPQAPGMFGGGGGSVPLPRMFVDCGDDDFLLGANFNLVQIIKSKGYPVEFIVRDGGHTWEYWRTALPLALKFVGDGFRN